MPSAHCWMTTSAGAARKEDTPETCLSRGAVLNRLHQQRQDGLQTTLLEVAPGEHGILVALNVRQPAHPGHDHDHEWTLYQTLTVHDRHRQVKGVGVCVSLGSRRGGPPMSDEFPSGHRLHANHLTPDALTVRPKLSAVTGWRAVAASSKVIAYSTERSEKLLRLLR
jgi:hypothetical protein